MRRWNSRSATRSSMRARWEPRQRCGPPPNARCRFGLRLKSTTSGSANSAGSVLAAPSNGLIRSPLLMGHPPTSTSCIATRATPGTGVSQRNNSSMALGKMSGCSTSWCRCSGWRARYTKKQPGDEEQEADVEQLLAGQWPTLPVHLRRDHRGQHVVARVGDVVVDGALEVLIDLLRHGCRGLVPAVVAGVALRADHPVLPEQKLVEVLQRQTEQLQEHGARKRDGELFVE